jgi:hypothetical protein
MVSTFPIVRSTCEALLILLLLWTCGQRRSAVQQIHS